MSEHINLSPEELELIDRYLHSDLQGEELSSFEERLLIDAGWKEKVDEVRLLSLGIREAALEEKLDLFHNNMRKPELKAVPERKGPKRWLAAASVIVFIILGGMLLFQKPESEKLFARYYKPDPGLPTVMSVSDNYEFEKAMVEYKLAHYKEAITGWEPLLKDHPQSDTLNYFLGSAYLADNNVKTAIPYFDKVISVKTSVFSEEAKWYRALLLVKEKNIPAAIAILETSSLEDAKQLLKELKKNSR